MPDYTKLTGTQIADAADAIKIASPATSVTSTTAVDGLSGKDPQAPVDSAPASTPSPSLTRGQGAHVVLDGPVEFSIYGPMKSGIAEAAKHRYHVVPNLKPGGKRWLYADIPNAADEIYVDGGKGSDGFGGRTLTFELVDGTTVDFIGPWHANPHDMLKETGVDLRGKHLTQGIAAFVCELGDVYKPDTYREVVHYDAQPAIGALDRIKHIAQAIANETGRHVRYGSVSNGGGQGGGCGPEPPENVGGESA